jgi:hypothetical protein
MRLAISTLVLIAATSAVAAPAPQNSWGKTGVSYDQYRLDSLECSAEGYNFDISNTDAAKAFVDASRRLETEIGSGVDPLTYQRIVNSARPGMHMREIKDLQLSVVEDCLVKRGYTKFRLNDEQRDDLKKLKVGSEERHMYLYKLGTDPNVLSSQSVAVTAAAQ